MKFLSIRMKLFIYYYSIAFGCIILFLNGFFPLQQNQNQKIILPPKQLKDISLNVSNLYRSQVDKMVLMVIDALRLDFVTLDYMPFLVSAYKEKGCLLTVKAEAPTVTLPRIKSLTTGSIPQFADIVFNLFGTGKHTNSFLHNAAEANKRVIFHGDDTWVKLYSDTFTRYEGFSTYYVYDFNEVDSNITRNVRRELKNEDWDVMVLHYSGLDHIGHVYGPYSNLVNLKLQEMDQVISDLSVYFNSLNARTLIAVTSDHGMKNSGGHGGATFEETHIPLVLLGTSCDSCIISQSDIPTTLSALMAIVLPANSIGGVIVNTLINLECDRILYILYYNAMVLFNNHPMETNLLNTAIDLHYNYLKSGYKGNTTQVIKLYEKYIKSTSELLIHSFIKQDEYILISSGIILLHCFSIIIDLLVSNAARGFLELPFLFCIFVFQFFVSKTYIFRQLLLFISITYFGFSVIKTVKTLVQWISYNSIRFVVPFSLAHAISLFSSSFIEEEHQFWYFAFGTFLIVQYYNGTHRSYHWFMIFILLRLGRMLNQTGDKWAHLPDLADWLLLSKNYSYLQILHCVSLLLIWVFYRRKLYGGILFLIYIFHICNSAWSALMGKMIWLCIGVTFGYNIVKHNRYLVSIKEVWVLICALLFLPHNVILIPMYLYASSVICKYLYDDLVTLTVVHIWLGKVYFFCQGHSNSLASIAIAPGYVGLDEYNTFVVATQIICHTYAFPILTTLIILNNSFASYDQVWLYSIGSQMLIIVSSCIVIFIHRHHLFIWTVFAPKLVFESCYFTVLLLEVCLFYFIMFMKSSLKY